MGYNKFASDVYTVKRVQDGEFILLINNIDFEIEIANNKGVIAGYTKDSSSNFRPIILQPRRRYYFRYNNNDSGEGILDVEVRLYDQYENYEIVWQRTDYSISGPFVFEDRILFHEEGDRIRQLV